MGEIAAGIASVATSLGASAGTAATIGTVATTGLMGAGLGAATSAISGGNPLTGALMGGAGGALMGGMGAFNLTPASAAGAATSGLSSEGSALVSQMQAQGMSLADATSAVSNMSPEGIAANLSDQTAATASGAGYGNVATDAANNVSSLAPSTPTSQSQSKTQNPTGGGNKGISTSAIMGLLSGAGSLMSQKPTPTSSGVQSQLQSAIPNSALMNQSLNPGSTANRTFSPANTGALNMNGPYQTPTMSTGSGVVQNPPIPGAVQNASSPYSNINPYILNPASSTAINYYPGGNYALPSGYAEGGDVHQPITHGGALSRFGSHQPVFSTGRGVSAVRGHGDGQSDDVDAKLSDGEYVLRADEVAAIGRGSNDAGAKKLDHFRDWLAHETGGKNRNTPARGGDGALKRLVKAV